MRILLVTQYFWPETFIINELTKCIQKLGHTVEVLTAKPNYPDGAIFKGYSAKKCITELYDDEIPVHRVPILPRGKGGGVRLAINYLSFVFSGLFFSKWLLKKKKFDIIFVFAPSPITSAIPALYLKKFLKIPAVLWIQDLWPESLSATGFVKNKFLLGLVEKMVRKIYACMDMNLVQSRAFLKPVQKYVSSNKVNYYPNSYFEESRELDELNSLPSDFVSTLKSKRCFIFAGNLGKAQSLDTVIGAAEQLKHLSDCRVILIGSGSMLTWIEEKIDEKKLDNVVLAGRFAPRLIPSILSYATALIVTLKKDEILTYTIPSKVQAYLSFGRPIIGAIDGEASKLIIESGAGLVSPAENISGLSKNIETLYNMSHEELREYGAAGRRYYLEHFDMMKQSQKLLDIFEGLLSPVRGC